jgi:hypothetical protein
MMADLDLARFKQYLAAYGARLQAWPEAARAEAEGLRVRSAAARELWRREAALDARLNAEQPLPPSPDLVAAVLAAAPSANAARVQGWRRWGPVLWPFGPPWQPAAGMAAAAMLGILVGFSEPANNIDVPSSFAGASDLIWEADEWETF